MFLKYFLYIINFVCCTIGITSIVVGALILEKVKLIEGLINSNVESIPWILITLGGVITIISFVGFFGALKESKDLLFVYAVFLFILAAAKCYLVYYTMSHSMEDLNEKITTYAFENHGAEFSKFEKAFGCCGTTGSDSYIKFNTTVPAICCENPVNNSCNCGPEICLGGCITRLNGYNDYAKYLILSVLALELVFMIAAVILCAQIKQKYDRYTC